MVIIPPTHQGDEMSCSVKEYTYTVYSLYFHGWQIKASHPHILNVVRAIVWLCHPGLTATILITQLSK